MFKRSWLMLSALSALILLPAAARADELSMGDPAPALQVGKFVKGEPVKQFEKGKIYVVEFWATWCGPCRESIPHLTEMQKKYSDVVFIGSNVGEDEETVKPFVEKMGDKMDYRVALDDMTKQGGANNAAFMDASGQQGIPTAFLIGKDSKVAWIGHPMELEPVLKKVVAGTYDVKKAIALAAVMKKIDASLETQDFDGAIKTAQAGIDADPDSAGPLGLQMFFIQLKGRKDVAAAAKVADGLVTKLDDAEELNNIADALAESDNPTPEVLATAQKLVEASLAKVKDEPESIDTLARIYALKGDFKKAVELETSAVDKCKKDDADMKQEMQKTLDAYKDGKVPQGE